MSRVIHYAVHHANTESSPDNDADDYLLCGTEVGDPRYTENMNFVTCKRCLRAHQARK